MIFRVHEALGIRIISSATARRMREMSASENKKFKVPKNRINRLFCKILFTFMQFFLEILRIENRFKDNRTIEHIS